MSVPIIAFEVLPSSRFIHLSIMSMGEKVRGFHLCDPENATGKRLKGRDGHRKRRTLTEEVCKSWRILWSARLIALLMTMLNYVLVDNVEIFGKVNEGESDRDHVFF